MSSLTRQATEAVHSATLVFAGLGDKLKTGGLFAAPAGFILVTPFFMPLVLHGTLLAWAAYAGQGTAATTQLTIDLYQHCFHAFTHARFDLSGLLDVNVDAVPKALLALLQNPFQLLPSPEEYLEHAQGLLLHSVLLSVLKLLVSTTGALLALAKVVSPNVPTSKVAGDWDFDGVDGLHA